MALPQGYLRISAVLVGGVALGWCVATLTNPAPPTTGTPLGGSTASAAMLDAANTKKRAGSGGSQTGLGFESEFTSLAGAAGTKPNDLLAAFRDAASINDATDQAIRLRQIMNTLGVADMPDALAKARKLPYSDQWRVLNELARRYAELDLKGALEFGLNNKTVMRYGNSSPFLSGVIAYWAKRSPDEAIAWVNSRPTGGQRRELTNSLAGALTTTNPEVALRLIKQTAGINQGPWMTENLFSTWWANDPGAAGSAVGELKGSTLQAAVRGLARTMARDDPKAALDWVSKLGNPTAEKNAIATIAEEWAQENPIAVIDWAAGLKDEDMRKSVRADAISKLAQIDLDAALRQIDKLPEGEQRDQMVLQAAEVLGNSDAQKALGLLDEMPNTPDKKRVLARLCAEWASSEPKAALDWLFKNGSPSAGDYNLNGIIGNWAQQNPDEALEWAQALPAQSGRDAAMAAIVSGFTNSDPARAQKMFSQLSPDGQAAAAGNITYALINQDFPKARAWAESLPNGKAQTAALGTIAFQYAYRDSTAAARWLQQLPPGDGRDKAIGNFAQVAVNKDPEGAIAWALTINDERDRTQSVENVAKRWIGMDSAAARQWIQGSAQLTPEQKKRILDR